MNREIRRIDNTVLIPAGECDTDALAVEKHKFNLAYAYLSGANLPGANLSDVNLIRSNLSGARYSTNELLQSYWSLPPKHPLILELMAHDAEYCGIAKMDEWAKGGYCPFKDSVREYFFPEDREMWLSANTEDKVPKLRCKKLLEALCEATNVRL